MTDTIHALAKGLRTDEATIIERAAAFAGRSASEAAMAIRQYAQGCMPLWLSQALSRWPDHPVLNGTAEINLGDEASAVRTVSEGPAVRSSGYQGEERRRYPRAAQ